MADLTQGLGPMVERNGILRPEKVEEQLEARCPAATLTRFGNTGRQAIHCGVAQDAFAIEDNPVGALAWCCSEYSGCPVWQAACDNDPVITRAAIARDRQITAAETRRQIASGMRVDDRGEEERLDYQDLVRKAAESRHGSD